MHILYVAHGYKPAYRLGGPVWSISALAEGMVARGHRVTVFATNGNGGEDLDVPTDRQVIVDGVAVRYFRREEPFKRYVPWLKYLSQSIGYLYTPDLVPETRAILPSVDVVHTQMPFVYPTQAAARLAIAARRPLFYSQRGVFDPSRLRFRAWKKSLYVRLVERPIMRRATGLVALTPEEISSFQALTVKTPIHLVPNGIDVTKFRRVAQSGSMADLGITDEQQVVLFLARLHETKGPDVLVDAFIKIAARHPDAVLVLAGSDEQGVVEGLRLRIVAAGLGARVICPGLITGERKLELLARADLFALPSVGEGLSMAVLEALASGTAVVISRECNLPIVETAGAGLVVSRTADDFARGLSSFLSERAALAVAGERAFALARDHFGWTPILDRLEAIYTGAIEGRTPGRPAKDPPSVRILHCVPAMVGGGAERQLAYLATEQVRLGCDVHVALIHGGPNLARLEAAGATVHRLPAFGNHDPQILIRLIRTVRAVKPDIVQCWLLQMEVLGGIAALWTGTPWVFSERASEEAYPRTFKTWCRVRIGARAPVIVSNSQAGDRYWQTRVGPRVRRLVIPNGVPLDEIAKVRAATTIDGSPLDPSVPVILNAGRFEPQKNLEAFVRAMRLVEDERSVQALCCGDGSLRKRIERLIADEGLSSVIRLEGYVTNLWGVMKRADALVSTSLFEGSPNVVLEAMACACPLVVSDIPEHRELLDKETAVFVNAHDPPHVAAGILQVLNDRSAATRRAVNARARVQRYSLASVARQYQALYQDLVTQHASEPVVPC